MLIQGSRNKKIDRTIGRAIFECLDEMVETADDPRALGKKWVGPRYGVYWRYRVGDARIICDIKDEKLVILVIEVGHRKDIDRP